MVFVALYGISFLGRHTVDYSRVLSPCLSFASGREGDHQNESDLNSYKKRVIICLTPCLFRIPLQDTTAGYHCHFHGDTERFLEAEIRLKIALFCLKSII